MYVCRNDRLQYGREIDIWSVGCICGELLLSAPIFQYDSDAELSAAIVRGLGVPDPKIWPEVEKLSGWESLIKNPERSDLAKSIFNRVCHRRPVCSPFLTLCRPPPTLISPATLSHRM